MRNVEVTRDEFNDFLYPAVGSSSAQSEQELETALRVMKKLHSPDITYVDELKDEQVRAAEAQGQKLIPVRRMRVEKATLSFEEDEHRLVIDRIKAYIPRISLLGAEALYNFLQKLVNADAEDAAESTRPKVL